MLPLNRLDGSQAGLKQAVTAVGSGLGTVSQNFADFVPAIDGGP